MKPDEHRIAGSARKKTIAVDLLPEAYAYYQVITGDENQPVDFLVLEVNRAYEAMVVKKEEYLKGRRLTELFPWLQEDPTTWILPVGKAALSTGEAEFEYQSPRTGSWYDVTAFSDQPGFVTVLFHDVTQRKQTEAHLKEERDLFTSGPVFTIIWEPDDYRIVKQVSANVADILGYTPEEMTAGDFRYDLLAHPDDVESAVTQANEYRRQYIDAYEQSYRLRTKSGEYRWFQDHTRIIRDTRGMITHVRGYLVDQTNLKETEAILSLERRRLEDIIEATHAGTWEYNVQTGLLLVNETWGEQIGIETHPNRPLMTREWESFVHPEDRAYLQQQIQDSLDGKTPYFEAEYRKIHRDGRVMWMHDLGKIVSYTKDGKPMLMSGSQTDITARKQAELERKAVTEKYQTLVDQSTEMLYLHDMEGRILEVNQTALDEMGYSREEFLRMTVFDLHSPEEIGRVKDWMDWPLNKIIHLSVEHMTKGGKRILVDIRARKIFIGDGEYVLGLVRDVTEQKKAEKALREKHQELEKAKQAAEAANVIKSQFLANMSHEIRTPMNGILGFLQLMEETDLSVHQAGYLNHMKDSAENLMVIINDILDLSKIESGRMKLEDIPFNLSETLESAMIPFLHQAFRKGVELELVVHPGVPKQVVGDPVRLRQIMTNLVGNAVKFTQEGSVTLKVDSIKENLSEVHLKFAITDTGIGMTEDTLSQLFKPFYQADVSNTRTYGGTGLGLKISRDLVSLMGGRIEVSSQWNQGSTFTVQIPMGKTASGDVHSQKTSTLNRSVVTPRVENRVDQKDLRVLLVEDQAINRELTSHLMKSRGLQCDVVENGLEAVNACLAKNYHLVLMDIQMPVMDGYEATRQIRMLTEIQQPKIVAMTARAMKEDEERCLVVGMDGFMSKPISLHKVTELLERYTHLKSETNGKTAADASTEGELPHWDDPETVIQNLMKETGFDEESTRQLFRDGVIHCSQLITDAMESLRRKEHTKVAARLHQMRGNAANLRLKGMTKKTAQAESFLRMGEEEKLEHIMTEIKWNLSMIKST